MTTPKLSILICSLESRKHLLARLLANLETQIKFLPDPSLVEIVVEKDNGEKTTGEKRNILLDRAQGEWISYIDDDDSVSFEYCDLILKALESNPDSVGINLIMTWSGAKAERSFHIEQFKNQEWFDIQDPLQPDRRTYFRGPNHLNITRTSICRQVRFPEVTQGEDRVFSYGICKLIDTMVNIEPPIYFYLFNPHK